MASVRLSTRQVLNVLRRPRTCQNLAPTALSIQLGLRNIHVSPTRLTDRPTTLTNILASDIPPPVQVLSVSKTGIKLADGLVLTGPVIFLDGKVFLWDVPNGGFSSTVSTGDGIGWEGWTSEHWSMFEVVVPKPEILVFGTGARVEFVPPRVRSYITGLGIQLDVMDTRNASSTYNLLAEEGRRVAAALLPLEPKLWERKKGF
ncbi:DUF498-domain-containing protein [Pisolithus orientalis]|uniref:DUF498-domain-containing protein n=1 Tax=Pisolithus orientalis TaxID=936130 RepID=UPI0022250D63|nr:DUF498-domain-containing protein [Pisolithus orientalis]KAI6034951.1 DUF498-domain-containing protein [Pisolithus orientalis]